jgi:hypothetical protein
MDAAAINRLIGDIEISIGIPGLVLLLGLSNSRFPSNRQSRGLRSRLVILFALLSFLFCIITFSVQDRATLIDFWRGSPLLYSLVYFLCAITCVLGIVRLIFWKLRPKLWRDDEK